MFKNPFSFNGRVRRLEYGLSLIVLYLMVMALGIISDLIASSREWDIMNTHLILLFAESDPGFNEYGPNPKGI